MKKLIIKIVFDRVYDHKIMDGKLHYWSSYILMFSWWFILMLWYFILMLQWSLLLYHIDQSFLNVMMMINR